MGIVIVALPGFLARIDNARHVRACSIDVKALIPGAESDSCVTFIRLYASSFISILGFIFTLICSAPGRIFRDQAL